MTTNNGVKLISNHFYCYIYNKKNRFKCLGTQDNPILGDSIWYSKLILLQSLLLSLSLIKSLLDISTFMICVYRSLYLNWGLFGQTWRIVPLWNSLNVGYLIRKEKRHIKLSSLRSSCSWIPSQSQFFIYVNTPNWHECYS